MISTRRNLKRAILFSSSVTLYNVRRSRPAAYSRLETNSVASRSASPSTYSNSSNPPRNQIAGPLRVQYLALSALIIFNPTRLPLRSMCNSDPPFKHATQPPMSPCLSTITGRSNRRDGLEWRRSQGTT